MIGGLKSIVTCNIRIFFFFCSANSLLCEGVFNVVIGPGHSTLCPTVWQFMSLFYAFQIKS